MGISNGNYSYFIGDDLSYFRSEWENVSSVYFDLIVGVNFNLTKFIHRSIEYQYGLIGTTNQREVSSIFNNPAHGIPYFLFILLFFRIIRAYKFKHDVGSGRIFSTTKY